MAAVVDDVPTVQAHDQDVLYRAVASRDRRFDGRFVIGVTTTGIYCKPSCPARTPAPENIRYFSVPAAAVAAGYRACRRCRPEKASLRPHIADDEGLVDRALTLIAQGVVDEHGIAGLASRLAVSERHLHRQLVRTVGTGALALAQARRAQLARTLLDQTSLPVTEVAFAAGFGSLRQFNDVIRQEYGATPSALRGRHDKPDRPAGAGHFVLRLPVTGGWDGHRMLAFLGARAVAGIERYSAGTYGRSVTVAGHPAVVELSPGDGYLQVRLTVADLAALGPAVTAVRRLCDLSADIDAAEDTLSSRAPMRELVRRRPGLRVPGTVDGWELAVRAVVGQQVSLAAACTLLGRIIERAGEGLPRDLSDGEVTRRFPGAGPLLHADLAGIGLPRARIASLCELANTVVSGELTLEPGDDVEKTRRRLLGIHGIGPWTAEYIAMRALADPDAWPATDLVLRREATRYDVSGCRPWRAYAAMHIWTQWAEEKQ